jgi:hypothetical protein
MDSIKKKSKKIKKHKSKDKHNKKKRKRTYTPSSSSDSSSTSSSSSSSSESDHHKKKKKHFKKKLKSDKKDPKKSEEKKKSTPGSGSDADYSIPLALATSSTSHRPETKEEYEKRQSVVRRVVDPETGRSRLVKGDGEIIEEIVSKERHQEINRLATNTDGQVFQKNTVGWNFDKN